MNKSIYILFYLLFCSVTVNGQGFFKNVTFNVFREDKDSANNTVVIAAQNGTLIYLFRNKENAERKKKDLTTNIQRLGDKLAEGEYDESLTLRNGKAEGQFKQDLRYCFAIYTTDGYSSEVYTIKADDDIVKLTIKKAKDSFGDRQLQTVVTKGVRTVDVDSSDVFAYGKDIVINLNTIIHKEVTDSKTRYILSPLIYVDTDTTAFTSKALEELKMDSVLRVCKPLVKDGEKYASTMFRRMGYDSENDMLNPYVDTLETIKTRERDYYFKGKERIENTNPNHRYVAKSRRWYENYTNVVLTDTIVINDGSVRRPFRFLEFSADDASINIERYWIEPNGDIINQKTPLYLNFKSGKATLEPNDSAGYKQIDDIAAKVEHLREIGADIGGAVVKGQTSPEGGISINSSLSVDRAKYLAKEFSNRVGSGLPIKIEATVGKWEDIAELLEADSADNINISSIAQEVRGIVAANKDERSIESTLRKKSYWHLIDSVYLPLLRKDEIMISYKAKKIQTKDEVISDYKTIKNYVPTEPYQFYYLFEHLQSHPAELKRYAKIARDNASFSLSWDRHGRPKPWILASYFYAKALISEGASDPSILSPYIELNSRLGLDYEMKDADGNLQEIVNDSAIVLTQIRMLANNGDFGAASQLANTLVRNQKMGLMLHCLAGKVMNDSEKEFIKETSNWNNVVMLASDHLRNEENIEKWKIAYDMLNDPELFIRDNAREYYMLAILSNRLFGYYKTLATKKTPYEENLFKFNGEDYQEVNWTDDEDTYPKEFGGWMIKCCEMDPSYLNILRLDGEFSSNYRDGFANYWNKLGETDPAHHRHLR